MDHMRRPVIAMQKGTCLPLVGSLPSLVDQPHSNNNMDNVSILVYDNMDNIILYYFNNT